ncbi:MAG: GNAT family N-acetyltransferase [Micropepsaceae bacterium]
MDIEVQAASKHGASLAARVEEACLNAWPALQEVHYDGWLLRLADGKTRRTNSVNVLRSSSRSFHEKIAYCEAFYRQHHLPPHFRILSNANDGLDAVLHQHGYDTADETATLYMDFSDSALKPPRQHAQLIETAPSREWVDARLEIMGETGQARPKLEKILHQLSLPAVFAATRGKEGRIDAVAKGAIHDAIVCLNLVATRSDQRRKGLSAICVTSILDWARGNGARGACLQVVAANTPAINLYQKLGFTRELYRYHYRTKAV